MLGCLWIHTSFEGAFSIKEGRWASKTNHSNDGSQFACKNTVRKASGTLATFIPGDLTRMTLHRNEKKDDRLLPQILGPSIVSGSYTNGIFACKLAPVVAMIGFACLPTYLPKA